MTSTRLIPALTLGGLLLLAWWILSQGLPGGFLFDDYHNLKGLETIVRQPSLGSFLHYTLTGLSSSLGRPLSLASFAAQFSDWPANPAGFKTVNILIHLLNGALVYLFLGRLLRLGKAGDTGIWIALLATALWLLHPLQVSTVLYAVQRMVELSALFVLLGMLAYLHGRQLALDGHAGQGYAWMSLGMVFGLGLGVLAKENAVLLPLFVLIVEATLLQDVHRPGGWRRWAWLFLGMPLGLFAGYLLLSIDGFANTYAHRDFSLVERLLTECRILFEYLRKLLLPTPNAFGLLFDDFQVSTGLWSPPVTMFAVTGIAAMLGAGFWLRRRLPVVAFAIFWFFGAHLLESTAIPLELYFEHRNYVAIIGPLLALSWFLYRLLRRTDRRTIRTAIVSGAILYLGMTSAITFGEARLWGDPLVQAAIWAETNPDSKRIQYGYANQLLMQGRISGAANIYADAAERWPDSAAPAIALLEVLCHAQHPPLPDTTAIARLLSTQVTEQNETFNFLSRLVSIQAEGGCQAIPPHTTMMLLNAAFENPYFRGSRHYIHVMRSRVYETMDRPELAVAELTRAYELRPDINTAFGIALLYAQTQQPREAREFLLAAAENPRVPEIDKLTYRNDVRNLLAGIDGLIAKGSSE